MGMIGLAPWLL